MLHGRPGSRRGSPVARPGIVTAFTTYAPARRGVLGHRVGRVITLIEQQFTP
jgi:hypothetical protein